MRGIHIIFMALLAAGQLQAAPQDTGSDFERAVAEAQSAQSAGDFRAAASAYRRAAAVRSDIPELWANLGLMEHQIGSYQDAIASFQRALHLNSDLLVPNLFLGIDLLEVKRYEEALPFLTKAEKIQPSDVEVAMAMGRAYAALHRPLKASDAYARAITIDNTNARAWFGLGVMALEEVERDARVLLDKYKSSPFVDALTAQAFQEENKPVETSTYFAKAATGPHSPLCIETEFALSLLQQHKPDLAQTALRKEPGNGVVCPLTNLVLSRLHIEQDEVPAQWDDFVAIWRLNEDLVETTGLYLWKGMPSADSQKAIRSLDMNSGFLPEEERELLRQDISAEQEARPIVLQIASTLAGRHICLAKEISKGRPAPEETMELQTACSFYSGDYWSASLQARQLQSSSLTEAVGLYWEIRANQRVAVAALARASEEAPNAPQMHVLLGDIQRQHKHLEEAQLEYNKALALKPSDPGALLGLGLTRFLMGDLAGALNAGQSLLKDDPNDPRTNLLVGEALVGLHRYEEAQPYLTRSLDSEPEMLPRVHALLGRCYAEGGLDGKAIEEFKLALSGDEDGSVHYQLALLYRKKGDSTDAKALLEDSKKLHREQLERASIALQEVLQTSGNTLQ